MIFQNDICVKFLTGINPAMCGSIENRSMSRVVAESEKKTSGKKPFDTIQCER